VCAGKKMKLEMLTGENGDGDGLFEYGRRGKGAT
jgi:hypothetical protein